MQQCSFFYHLSNRSCLLKIVMLVLQDKCEKEGKTHGTGQEKGRFTRTMFYQRESNHWIRNLMCGYMSQNQNRTFLLTSIKSNVNITIQEVVPPILNFIDKDGSTVSATLPTSVLAFFAFSNTTVVVFLLSRFLPSRKLVTSPDVYPTFGVQREIIWFTWLINQGLAQV